MANILPLPPSGTIAKELEKGHFYLYPSSLFAALSPTVVNTILGTCVSVCLWDPHMKIGGINHYMLPHWNGEGLASPKYGNIAIEKLIQAMLQLGAKREHLQAKVFGGKSSSEGHSIQYRVGERNAQLAITQLHKENIQVVSSSLGGGYGRKLIFHTDTGEVYMYLIKSF